MRLFTAILPVCAALFPALALATTWYVPSQCPTIQAGIDSASAGDTVLVACGTYYEHGIVMKSGICLRSETGTPDCVTIDAQRLNRVIGCSSISNTTRIEGFTLTGGHARAGDLGNNGGAIVCYYSSSPVIVDCVFRDNWAEYDGGGLFCNYSSPTVINCTFQGNRAVLDGGGMYCCSSSFAEVRNCTFHQNYAGSDGGGFFCWLNSSPLLENTIIAWSTRGEAVGCDGSLHPDAGVLRSVWQC